MNYDEKIVSDFKVYAKGVLDEQITALNDYDNSPLKSGKLSRFKTFNTHLDILKQRLEEKVKQLLMRQEKGSLIYIALTTALDGICAEYINEYMCISFLKK